MGTVPRAQISKNKSGFKNSNELIQRYCYFTRVQPTIHHSLWGAILPIFFVAPAREELPKNTGSKLYFKTALTMLCKILTNKCGFNIWFSWKTVYVY